MVVSCPSYEAEAELIDEGHDVSVLYQWEIPSNVSPSDSNSTSSKYILKTPWCSDFNKTFCSLF